MNKQQQKFREQQEEMEYQKQLQEVRVIELKARFWKAQFEIRHYTLQAENLQGPYDEYVAAQRVKNEQAMKEYQEMLEKLSQEQIAKTDEHGNIIHTVTEEDLTNNPELVEAGVKEGEEIGIPEEQLV